MLALGAALLTLFAVEALLQYVDYPPACSSGWLAYRHFPAEEHNELGYRGRRYEYGPEDFVVLLVGDSHVTAAAWPFDQMPERYLEFHLRRKVPRCRVFSLGTYGYGQDQQLLALQRYFARYRADLVVLWLTPMNDLWNNTFPTHGLAGPGTPKPTFWMEKGKLRGPAERLGEDLNAWKVPALFRRVIMPGRDERWEAVLPPPYYYKQTGIGNADPLWQEASQEGRFAEYPATEKSHLAVLFTPRSGRMEYSIQLTRHLLGRMQETAAEHGAKFLMIDAQHPWQLFGDSPSAAVRTVAQTWREGEKTYAYEGRSYKTSRAQYEENLRDLTEGFPFHLVVLTMADCTVNKEDMHFNDFANDIIAESITRAALPLVPQEHLRGKILPWKKFFQVDFSQPFGEGITGSGFHPRERWGRWTRTCEAFVRFARPLPEDFDLVLEARGFGPNTEVPVEVLAPGAHAEVEMKEEKSSYRLSFRGVGPGNELRFRVQRPVSPKELGIAGDIRPLGLGLHRLEIIPTNIGNDSSEVIQSKE
jgi:hypothetical protein